MDCPVCKNAQVEEGATQCPECSSDLSSFNLIHQITKQRGGLRKTSLILSIVLLLALGGWGATTYMNMSGSGTATPADAEEAQAPADDDNAQVSELNAQVEKQKGEIEQLTSELEELLATIEAGVDEKGDFKIHVVQEGESLWSISEEHHGEGHKHAHIADHNEIDNPHYIKVGDTIIIKH